MDTADTSSLNGGNLDVTLVTPDSAPGVTDDVVVLAIFATVANGGNSVIELGSALLGVEDTTGVGLEDGLISLDGDRDGLLGNSSLELRNRSGFNVGVGSNLSDGGSLVHLARSDLAGSRGVRIVFFEINTVFFLELEGLVLPTTLATEAVCVARDELLLRERSKLTVGDEIDTLSGGDGGESPA